MRRGMTMANLPKQVAEFLSKKRIAVVGVSRDKNQPANAIYRKLKQSGYTVYAINPNAQSVEDDPCYPDFASLPEKAEAAMIVTHPEMTVNVIRQCAASGIKQVWIHRSFGDGSVSEEAVRECEKNGIDCMVGGCPMMYCEPVDVAHKCMKWILKWQKRVPV